MNQSPTRPPSPTRKRPRWQTAKVQPIVLILVFFILIIAGGAFWYYRAHQVAGDASETGTQLSERTLAVLKRLRSPVEIRFYSLLGEEGSSDSLRAFAGRVDQLLSDYKQESDGKIKVTRYDSRSETDMDAASADGISAFNLDKGEPCFLGLSVVQDDQKESLPRISPDWEQALEADLTRAILGVSGAQSLAAQAAAAALAGSSEVEEVKRAIPNLDSVSLEDGKQILRTRAMEELKAANTELQAQVQQAQQRLSEAQNGNSESAQEAAMKQLQQAQAAQSEMIKEIAARLQAQITAVEQLKGAPASNR